MSAAVISEHACPSECSDTEAMEPVVKRARIEVKPFQEINLNQFILKNNGKGKNGQNTFPLVAGEPIRFNFTPNGWIETPFGFDISGKYEYPSFLGGPSPDKEGTPECLSLRLNLHPEQAEFLSKLDDVSQKAFALVAEATWNPLVAKDTMRNLESSKVKVVLKGADLTKLTIVHNGAVTRGEGWDFLKGFLAGSGNCRRAGVKATVRVKKLWNVAKKAGLSLEATQMVLRIDKPVEEEAYSNDAELLA
jgi:hypothetical protein